MHAYLHSARLAPKKANLVARMVRGMPVPDAVELLRRTHKKGARLIEGVLRSAMANASHTFKQDPQTMIVKTLIVNQGMAYQRGVPMARGRVRPIKKFMSHISVTLGYPEEKKQKIQKSQRNQKSAVSTASQSTSVKQASQKRSSVSSDSSVSSASSKKKSSPSSK
jgi:large subunit ribosomal protein L22